VFTISNSAKVDVNICSPFSVELSKCRKTEISPLRNLERCQSGPDDTELVKQGNNVAFREQYGLFRTMDSGMHNIMISEIVELFYKI